MFDPSAWESGYPTRPSEVEGYSLYEKLGSGCMKTVYLAHHPDYFDDLAVALVEPSVHRDWERRFKEEVASFRKLKSHDHIIGFYEGGPGTVIMDDGSTQERLYFCMELAETTLAQYLGNSGMNVQMALNWLLDISRAVSHAHHHGILHRDIKPENVLVTAGGIPKLSDFGFVKDLTREHHWTETQSGLGTEGYVAPEQMAGSRYGVISVASDVYSLGAMLLEMLVGRFRYHTHIAQCQQKAPVRAYATIASLLEQVEHEFRRTSQTARLKLLSIAQMCLQLDVNQRLSNVNLLIELLEDAASRPEFSELAGRT